MDLLGELKNNYAAKQWPNQWRIYIGATTRLPITLIGVLTAGMTLFVDIKANATDQYSLFSGAYYNGTYCEITGSQSLALNGRTSAYMVWDIEADGVKYRVGEGSIKLSPVGTQLPVVTLPPQDALDAVQQAIADFNALNLNLVSDNISDIQTVAAADSDIGVLAAELSNNPNFTQLSAFIQNVAVLSSRSTKLRLDADTDVVGGSASVDLSLSFESLTLAPISGVSSSDHTFLSSSFSFDGLAGVAAGEIFMLTSQVDDQVYKWFDVYLMRFNDSSYKLGLAQQGLTSDSVPANATHISSIGLFRGSYDVGFQSFFADNSSYSNDKLFIPDYSAQILGTVSGAGFNQSINYDMTLLPLGVSSVEYDLIVNTNSLATALSVETVDFIKASKFTGDKYPVFVRADLVTAANKKTIGFSFDHPTKQGEQYRLVLTGDADGQTIDVSLCLRSLSF